jgi:hypothetical protein
LEQWELGIEQSKSGFLTRAHLIALAIFGVGAVFASVNRTTAQEFNCGMG